MLVKLKNITAVLLVTVVLVGFGLYRLNSLNNTPINASNFSWLNKCEIYVLGLVASALAYPFYPEVAREHLMMYTPSDERERIIKDDFFLRSGVVQKAVTKARERGSPQRLTWPASAYLMTFDWDAYWEARIALAMNGGLLSVDGDQVSVRVNISYPKQSFAPLFEIPLFGTIGIEEGLFWFLQQEGWLFSGYVEWTATEN